MAAECIYAGIRDAAPRLQTLLRNLFFQLVNAR
jgi:hypothetical protein